MPEVAAAVGVAAAGVAAAAGNPVRSARRRRESAARRLAADLDPRAGGRLARDLAVPRGHPVPRITQQRADVRPIAEVAIVATTEATSAKGADCEFLHGVSRNISFLSFFRQLGVDFFSLVFSNKYYYLVSSNKDRCV